MFSKENLQKLENSPNFSKNALNFRNKYLDSNCPIFSFTATVAHLVFNFEYF